MKDYLDMYSRNIYPFHMPGHKLGRLSPLNGQNLFKLDVTEVDGTDQLFHSSGIIYEAQKQASELYESLETFFLINGSSCGLLSAISACSKPDGKIIISRNSHKSVYNAILLNRLDPIYIYPDEINEYHLLGGIDPKTVEEALKNEPEICCVVITSPTYEGFTSDIASISDVIHRHGKILIVDEAHGSHFKFNEYFPKTALECGADIVIHSLHKTLPAFTQSALLHVNSNRVDREKIKQYLEIYQSSSPSYILMSGIDSCLKLIKDSGSNYFTHFIEALDSFRNKVEQLNNLKLINKEIIGKYNITGVDSSKLLFAGKKRAINGKQVERTLREQYQIQVEMAMQSSFLALTTIADQTSAFEQFFKALKDLDQRMQLDFNNILNEPFEGVNKQQHQTTINDSGMILQGEKFFTPYEVSQMPLENILLKDSYNRICGQFVSIFPPGIPILIPGEKIKEVQIRLLKDYIIQGFSIIGIEHDTIKVVK